MEKRAYRQLAREVQQTDPRKAAGDSVLRLALSMFCADPRACLTEAQQAWMTQRLAGTGVGWRCFSAAEKRKLCGPLLAYIGQYHPRILAIVEAQFLMQ